MAMAIPILAVASAVIGAVGSIQAANAQRRASNYNQALAQRNSQIATNQGTLQEETHRTKMQRLMGHNRAQYGASGVTMEGSPLDVLSDMASQGEQDLQTIRYNTEVRASGHEGTAQLESMRAKNARTAGYLSAGQAVLLHGAKVSNGGNGTESSQSSGMGFKIPSEVNDPYGYAP